MHRSRLEAKQLRTITTWPRILTQVLTFVDGRTENQPLAKTAATRRLKADGGGSAVSADVGHAYLGDTKAWDRPDLIGRALTARRLAEAAVASPDLVTQYWIRNLVDSADAGDHRRLAEDNLYVGSPDALKQAESLWENVAAAEGDGGKYREALRRGSAALRRRLRRSRPRWADGSILTWPSVSWRAACRHVRRGKSAFALLDGTQKAFGGSAGRYARDGPVATPNFRKRPRIGLRTRHQGSSRRLTATSVMPCGRPRTTRTRCEGSPPCLPCR